ncbi:MAG: hypothetical protein V9F03_10560 [Microthrixaceae bacterium]
MAVAAVVAFWLPEPVRGQWEKAGRGRRRWPRTPTSRSPSRRASPASGRSGRCGSVIVGFSALGFILFPRESLANFFLEEEFGLDALGRGSRRVHLRRVPWR